MLPFALLLAVPVALMVTVSSPGPILFQQMRMGWKGRPFVIFKFRTMRVDHEGAGYTSSKDEDRITSIGKFLRKTRLDEIPQLINIIKGEMSWIGPRPESLVLAKWYCRDVPLFRIRHLVRPGISGWAQVNQGYAAGVDDMTIKVRYDLYYIKHLSIWLDITILLKTIIVVLSGRGSR
jgi:Sugar transferases involved in lipopolysaccharide synthesis